MYYVDELDCEYIREQLNFSSYLQAKRIHIHHIKNVHELAVPSCLPWLESCSVQCMVQPADWYVPFHTQISHLHQHQCLYTQFLLRVLTNLYPQRAFFFPGITQSSEPHQILNIQSLYKVQQRKIKARVGFKVC